MQQCEECGTLELQVLRSAAGYYIGTACNCGPYSRESGYFRTHEDAVKVLWIYEEEQPSDDDLRDLAADARYQEAKDRGEL